MLASGPSLTVEDVETVRVSGIITVAVNSTWKMAPFCDVLYAGDYRWWKSYGNEVNIPAKRISRSSNAEKKFRAKYHKTKLGKSYNSGQLAVEYALARKAKKVILLGFDGSIANGIHHHGPHDKSPNPNEDRCRRWQPQFKDLAKVYKGADIVNCSRYTEIECFPRMSLEDALCGLG